MCIYVYKFLIYCSMIYITFSILILAEAFVDALLKNFQHFETILEDLQQKIIL